MLLQDGLETPVHQTEPLINNTHPSSISNNALNSLVIHSNRAESLDELGSSILDWWMRLDNSGGGILYLYNEAGQRFVPLCSRGYPEEMAGAPLEYSSNQAVFDRLFQERDVLTGRHQRPAGFAGSLHKPFISTLTLPVASHKRKIGLLQLVSEKPSLYESHALACLQQFAHESAILIERMELLERQRSRLDSFNCLFNRLPEPILVLDEEGMVARANQAAVQVIGRSAAELKRHSWQDLLELEEGIRLEERAGISGKSLMSAVLKADQLNRPRVQMGMSRFQWDDRQHILLHIKPDGGPNGNPGSKPGDLYRAVFDHSADLICVYSDTGTILAINPAGLELLGYPVEEVVGRSIYGFLPEAGVGDVRKLVEQQVETGHRGRADISIQNAAGDLVDLDFSTRVLPLDGETVILAGMGRNITERKKVESDLKYRSHHDGLTGLYNRHLFDSEMLRYETGEMDPVGIVICDIDGLKKVNDSQGHLAGDELLKAGSRVLRQCFRDGDIVARIGGDEFGILMPHSSWNGLRAALARLDQAIANYNTGNPDLPLKFSRGCAVRYSRFKTLRETMQEADDQMYRHKTGDKNRPGAARAYRQGRQYTCARGDCR